MGGLTLVRAGAGTGKTFDLCRMIAAEVTAGQDPARILATTFTRKAAAELAGRIQERILAHDALAGDRRVELAGRLELALIGTVHTVGRRLLERYAFEVGLSPRLEVLEEEAEQRALRELVGLTDPGRWDELIRLCNRLGLGEPNETVLELMTAQRANRIGDGELRAQLAASAERLCAVMAECEPGGDGPGFDDLYHQAEVARDNLCRIDEDSDSFQACMVTLAALIHRRGRMWQDFGTAWKLDVTHNKDAKAALGPLKELAGRVLASPELHADVRALAGHLAEEVAALGADYRRYKDERGLLDFIDLETGLLGLVEQAAPAEDLGHGLDVAVVDEFQDTNPLQLEIFERLLEVAGTSRWVGDRKQAIYAFRGADAELVERVWERFEEHAGASLGTNYRSVAGLVQLVGRLFEPVFGPEAVLQPARGAAERAVERWVIAGSNLAEERAGLVAGIRQLEEEGWSRADIAVLARTNDHAREIGRACRERGLPVLVEVPGLLATREGALTLAGLRYVADDGDTLAGAQVLHILGDPEEETPAWLERRLEALRGGDGHGWSGEPVLEELRGLAGQGLAPSMLVQAVVDTLDIPGVVARWGGPAARLANLDTLMQMAREWEQEVLTVGLAPTLGGLIAHLEALVDEDRDMILPPYGIDALTIQTFHRAKGLQWPVVILTGGATGKKQEMFAAEVTGGSAGADDPLEGRTVRYWPWPFGRGRYNKLKAPKLNDWAINETPEGQRRAEAERREAQRLLYVGCTRAERKLVLAHRAGKYDWLSLVPGLDQVLDPGGPAFAKERVEGEPIEVEELDLDGIDTTYVRRSIRGWKLVGEAASAPAAGVEWWLERPVKAGPVDDAPRYSSPSAVRDEGVAVVAEAVDMGGERLWPQARSEDEQSRLGDAVHAYLAALPSMDALDRAGRAEVAARCLEGFGVGALLAAEAVVGVGERLAAWIVERFTGASWMTEVPVVAPRSAGGSWRGDIDLLLSLADGGVVVVDHKCGPVRRDECEARAARYAGQLAAYREALEALGHDVREVWIHFGLAGMMVRMGEG